jgi:antitoxin component of MazEF toxin-antitoxin module
MYNLPSCSILQVTARVRRVGNSLSVVIPAEKAKAEKISEGDMVQIEIQKKVNIQDLFGSLKSGRSSQRAKDEARSGWGD